MATVVGLPASNEGLHPSLFNSPPPLLDTYRTLPSIVPLQCVAPLSIPPLALALGYRASVDPI